MERFTHSLAVDRRLLRHDLLGSLAHARMLGKTKIIPASGARTLIRVLESLVKQERQGKLRLDPSAEDVHTAIQLLVYKKAGRAAGCLHTARSRNDQVVTALRLYCKEKIRFFQGSISTLQKAILKQAEKARGQLIPGYTHLRHAQPVLVAHLLLSYLEALERDKGRLSDLVKRVDILPLGSGALAGTSLPIDRHFTARELGFAKISDNSIDGVTSRDFAVEFLSSLSILSLHLSRVAEDLLLWSTAEFGFLRFDETLLTGSSMMPQKQNPDFLELIRAGAAHVAASLNGITILLKGLSSGYQRDLQGDKELLFAGIDKVEAMLEVLTEGFQSMHWNPRSLERQLADPSLYATDCAEYLVAQGVAFAQAHRIVGRLFVHAEKAGTKVSQLPLSTLRRFSPLFDSNLFRLFDPSVSVSRKRSHGSTHPVLVKKAIGRWKKLLS